MLKEDQQSKRKVYNGYNMSLREEEIQMRNNTKKMLNFTRRENNADYYKKILF